MVNGFLKKSVDFFIFSSLYIALCAVLMVYQTNHLLHLHYQTGELYLFVFFSTIYSYNFHWYLTPHTKTEMIRVNWTQKHKTLHLVLYLVGLIGSAWFALRLIEHWQSLAGAVFLTFLYSAPKLPLRPFAILKKIAVGKTIFLGFVWMYVTTLLPIIFSEQQFQIYYLLFCISRFFLIYSICIVFDYKDRQQDKEEGIRSMITYLDDRGIDVLFYISVCLFALSTVLLHFYGFQFYIIALLLLPGFVLVALYKTVKRNFSDYLYYFVLDGLMMVSALFTSLLSI